MKKPGLRQGQQLSLYANTIAVALSKELTLDEENVIGNLLTLVGASLLAIAAVDASAEEAKGQ